LVRGERKKKLKLVGKGSIKRIFFLEEDTESEIELRGGEEERSQRRTREVGSFAGLIVRLIVSCNSSFPNISTGKLINIHAFM